jgi:hypothetical protein
MEGNGMRKIASVVGVAVLGAVAALVASGPAQAAPPVQPNFSGHDFIVPVSRDAEGSYVATLPENWLVGDCVQLMGSTMRLIPSSGFVLWQGQLLTTKTSNRDIWFESVTFTNAQRLPVGLSDGRLQGPDMKVGPLYGVDSFGTASFTPAFLPQITSAKLHGDC